MFNKTLHTIYQALFLWQQKLFGFVKAARKYIYVKIAESWGKLNFMLEPSLVLSSSLLFVSTAAYS